MKSRPSQDVTIDKKNVPTTGIIDQEYMLVKVTVLAVKAEVPFKESARFFGGKKVVLWCGFVFLIDKHSRGKENLKSGRIICDFFIYVSRFIFKIYHSQSEKKDWRIQEKSFKTLLWYLELLLESLISPSIFQLICRYLRFYLHWTI